MIANLFKNVCVYVTNILTEINLIFTFYSGYWLSLSPVMVFWLNYHRLYQQKYWPAGYYYKEKFTFTRKKVIMQPFFFLLFYTL